MLKVTINEKGGGERILSFDKERITIGRSQRNDIILPRSNVSKKHATVEIRGTSCVVTDLDSTNGTFVNGRRIKGPVSVGAGDKLFISDFIMVVEVPREAQAQAPVPPPLPGAAAAAPLPQPRPPSGGAGARAKAMAVASAAADAEVDAEAEEPDEVEPVEEEEEEVQRPRGSSRDSGRGGDSSERLREALLRSQSSPDDAPRRSAPSAQRAQPAQHARQAQQSSHAAKAANVVQPPVREAPADLAPPESEEAERPEQAPRPQKEARAHQHTARVTPAAATAPSAGEGEIQADLFRQVDGILDLDRLEPPIFADEDFKKKTSRTIAEVLDSLVDAGKIPQDIEPRRIAERVTREILGLGPVEAMLQDPGVSEIVVPPVGAVTIVGAAGSRSLGDPFVSVKSRRLVLKKLLAGIRERAAEGAPAVTGHLAGGEEVKMLLPPVVLEGLAAVIRKQPVARVGGLDGMVESGAMSAGMAQFLEYCIQGRQSLLVCDADLASHRSLVPAIASRLEKWERLVAVQCGSEPLYDLTPIMYASMPAERGLGLESTGADLGRVLDAFTPTALILGCLGDHAHMAMARRSREARSFTLSTMASSSDASALAIAAGWIAYEHPGITPSHAAGILLGTFDIVVLNSRMMDGSEKITRISELLPGEGGLWDLRPIFRWELTGMSDGVLEGAFRATRHVPAFVEARRGKTKGLRFDTTIFQ